MWSPQTPQATSAVCNLNFINFIILALEQKADTHTNTPPPSFRIILLQYVKSINQIKLSVSAAVGTLRMRQLSVIAKRK